jgi:DNA-binding beta-propeller fold protein YncE
MQGFELALENIQVNDKQASDDRYDAEADEEDVAEEDVAVEMITGGGGTHKFTLPPTATVLMLKHQVGCDAGFKSAEVKLYVHDDLREEALENGETLGSLRRGQGLAVVITLMVYMPDAQEVVAELATKADLVLGDTWHDQMKGPRGVAFVPAHPDWIVTTEYNGHCVKISNARTGALICKFGEEGSGEGQFNYPGGVTVTSDSSFVIVADSGNNHCVKVLRLVVAANRGSGHLEFVRHIGNGRGSSGGSEGRLKHPTGVALLLGDKGGQESVLVTGGNHRVSQFKLNGTFVRILAGTGTEGGGDGEFSYPCDITVLGSSGEVAVADFGNHRVQIFDREGNFKRQFGSKGNEADGQVFRITGLASDAHDNMLVLDDTNRLQVFSPEGKHLCTRNDLRVKTGGKGVAWSDDGKIAIANKMAANVLLWRNE